MGSDLDEKLEEIIFGDMPKHFMSDSMLAKPEQIKQAFIDAGWFTPADKELVQEIVNHRLQMKLTKDKSWRFDTTDKHPEDTLMTGQEWYDRFIRELPPPFPLEAGDPQEAVDYYGVKSAAKKVAGIK